MALETLRKTPALLRKIGQVGDTRPFYSPIDKAISEITQNKATGEQMLAALLKTKGVAKELKDRPAIKKALEQPKITKQELERVAAEHPPAQIEETVLGGAKNDRSLIIENKVTEDIDSIVNDPNHDFWFDELRRNYKNFDEMTASEKRKALERIMPRTEREREVRDAFEPQIRERVIDEVDRNVNFDDLLPTKFREQTIPGGKNYRELLIRLPSDSPEIYYSSHFDEPNILAHARVVDRTGPNGEKILHVEEIQSDWHQAGRDVRNKEIKRLMQSEGIDKATASKRVPEDYGYKTNQRQAEFVVDKGGYYEVRDQNNNFVANVMHRDMGNNVTPENALAIANSRIKSPQIGRQADDPRVPNVPFKQNWHELVMKRLLDDAARNGYDKVVITQGAKQADRYDLSRHVNEITVPMVNENGERSVRINPTQGASIKLMVDQNGVVTGYGSGSNQFTGKNLDEVIGKDMADKVMNAAPDTTFSGNDLQIGGEGMKGFYDQILPSFLNTYGKQYGARVGTYNLPDPEKHHIPTVADIVRGGMERFGTRDLTLEQAMEVERAFKAQREAETAIPLHSFDITPQMREDIIGKGLPLYQVAPVGIGAGAAMQGEQPEGYGAGGVVKKAVKAVLPKDEAFRLTKERSLVEPTHYSSAHRIAPPHEVRDTEKLNLLIKSMKENGWQGRPILTYDAGRGDEALTGSHRLKAAEEANIEVPIYRIENAGNYIDKNGNSIFDVGFMGQDDQVKWLNQFGDKNAAQLLKQEPEGYADGGVVSRDEGEQLFRKRAQDLPNLMDLHERHKLQELLQRTRIQGSGGKDQYGTGAGGRVTHTVPLGNGMFVSPYIEGNVYKPVGQPAMGGVTGAGLNIGKTWKNGGSVSKDAMFMAVMNKNLKGKKNA